MIDKKKHIIKNAITVDLEDWHHSIDSIPFSDWDNYESRVEANTHKILNLFEKEKISATFFILGYIAEKYPALVQEIASLGHEIATHGHAHQLVYRQSPKVFREDLKRAVGTIENVAQQKILGYRAPYWTITRDSYWALDILLEEGLKYDSSIFPMKTYLYGIPGAPLYPYIVKEKNGNKLIEFPPSVITFMGIRIPVAGGFYMRLLPEWLIRIAFKKINKENHSTIVYIHPPEFDPQKPRLNLPLMERILHYYNLDVMEGKIKSLVSEFEFGTIKDLLNSSELNFNEITN